MTLNSRPVTKSISFGSDISSSTQIADRYSDNLMDDLFIDVDQILAGDLSSAAAVSSPQADHQQGRQAAPIKSSARTVALPADFSPQSAADIYRATLAASSHTTGGGRPVTARATAPGETAPAAESIEVEAAPMQSAASFLYPSESLLALPAAGLAPRSPQTLLQPQPLKKLSLPFLLIGAVGISLISALGLWLLPSSSEPRLLLSLNKEAAAAELPDHSDQAFLQYLGQSLEVISARESSENQTVAAIPPALSPTAPPSATTEKTGTLPILPNIKAPANIVERVFVPVYENGQTAQSASQAGASVPTVPPSPTRIPLRAVTAPSVPPVPRATALPAPRPATTAAAPTNPTSGAAAAVTDVTPATDHVLVGILNLGDRSAAMFNIDGGSSQRAYVGDRIGLSSWTLVTVNGQDVVVRRDGEVRSIYIGQSF